MDNYYLKTLFEDNEQVDDNKNLKDIILKNEDLIFSNKITKIKKNTAEDRIIVLTTKFLYNLRGKNLFLPFKVKIRFECGRN